MPDLNQPSVSPRTRILCAAAALCTTSAITAALLAGWHHQSDPVWLAATPAVVAELATCDAQRARAERDQCKQDVVAARAPSRVYPVAAR